MVLGTQARYRADRRQVDARLGCAGGEGDILRAWVRSVARPVLPVRTQTLIVIRLLQKKTAE